jgi:hypothetical protein
MRKKLFRVTVEFDYVIVADDDGDSCWDVAEQNVRDAFNDLDRSQLSFHVVPFKMADMKKTTGWDEECIPYGGDGNTRTGEYLKGEK